MREFCALHFENVAEAKKPVHFSKNQGMQRTVKGNRVFVPLALNLEATTNRPAFSPSQGGLDRRVRSVRDSGVVRAGAWGPPASVCQPIKSRATELSKAVGAEKEEWAR